MQALSKFRQQKEVLNRLITFILSPDPVSEMTLPASEWIIKAFKFKSRARPSLPLGDGRYWVDRRLPQHFVKSRCGSACTQLYSLVYRGS